MCIILSVYIAHSKWYVMNLVLKLGLQGLGSVVAAVWGLQPNRLRISNNLKRMLYFLWGVLWLSQVLPLMTHCTSQSYLRVTLSTWRGPWGKHSSQGDSLRRELKALLLVPKNNQYLALCFSYGEGSTVTERVAHRRCCMQRISWGWLWVWKIWLSSFKDEENMESKGLMLQISTERLWSMGLILVGVSAQCVEKVLVVTLSAQRTASVGRKSVMISGAV